MAFRREPGCGRRSEVYTVWALLCRWRSLRSQQRQRRTGCMVCAGSCAWPVVMWCVKLCGHLDIVDLATEFRPGTLPLVVLLSQNAALKICCTDRDPSTRAHSLLGVPDMHTALRSNQARCWFDVMASTAVCGCHLKRWRPGSQRLILLLSCAWLACIPGPRPMPSECMTHICEVIHNASSVSCCDQSV